MLVCVGKVLDLGGLGRTNRSSSADFKVAETVEWCRAGCYVRAHFADDHHRRRVCRDEFGCHVEFEVLLYLDIE